MTGWSEALRREARALTLGVGRERLVAMYCGRGFTAHEDGSISASGEDFRGLLSALADGGLQDFELELHGGTASIAFTATDLGGVPCLVVIAIDRERRQTGLWVHTSAVPGGERWLVPQPGLVPDPALMGEGPTWSSGEADPLLVAAACGWLLANREVPAGLPSLPLPAGDDVVLRLATPRQAAAVEAGAVPAGIGGLLELLEREAVRVGGGAAFERSVALGYADGVWVTVGTLRSSASPVVVVGPGPGLFPRDGLLTARLRTGRAGWELVAGRLGNALGTAGRTATSREADWARHVAADALTELCDRAGEIPELAEAWQSELLGALLRPA